MKVLFQNSFVVLVEKPAGVLTVPSRFPDKDQRRVLGLELEAYLKAKIFPVHRLDFEVSGLVMFALTAEFHRVCNGWFERQQVKKVYSAVSQGLLPKEREFMWQSRLLRGKKRAYESEHGKLAKTKAELMTVQDQQLLWRLSPLTGRSHQLRYEMAKQGFSILGDRLYGSEVMLSDHEIALRSTELDFQQVPDFQKWQLPPKIEIRGFDLPVSFSLENS